MENRTIDEYINNGAKELDDPSVNSQRRRHLENEIERLEQYKIKYPTKEQLPSPLELFCSEYPDSSECRIYDV